MLKPGWGLLWAAALMWGALLIAPSVGRGDRLNLVKDPDFKQRAADGRGPAEYEISGAVEYRYLGDARRDVSAWGVALESAGRRGSVSQMVGGIHAADGRWYRFTFRGLAQDHFWVSSSDSLAMKVEFFGNGGATAYDGKRKPIYDQVLEQRKDFTTNGDFHRNGAAVWRTYQLDVYLPFPQVDSIKLTVEFDHGAGPARDSDFFVTGFGLTRLEDMPAADAPGGAGGVAAGLAHAVEQAPSGTLLSLGGRWYYQAKAGETAAPAVFNWTNADRLFYHDAKWETPFAGNMATYLRAGDKDAQGNIVLQDRYVPDNVTVNFTPDAMVIHTKGLPNHPTGKFPQPGFGPRANPNYIQEHFKTY